jgi:hypothetical protein
MSAKFSDISCHLRASLLDACGATRALVDESQVLEVGCGQTNGRSAWDGLYNATP